MKPYVRFALRIAALLYLAWSLSLLVAPGWVHGLLSTGPFDATTTALFGAALFGFVIVFLIAAHRPEREAVHAAVAGMLLIGVVSAYQMFVAGTMPRNGWTLASLSLDLLIALYLLMGLTEAAMNFTAGARPATKRSARRRMARGRG